MGQILTQPWTRFWLKKRPDLGPSFASTAYTESCLKLSLLAFQNLQILEATPQTGSFLQFWALLGSIFDQFLKIGSIQSNTFLMPPNFGENSVIFWMSQSLELIPIFVDHFWK